MILSELIKELKLEVKCCETALEKEITWCYCSDLLSDVMGNATKDSIWITLQTHPNIVAVASLIGLTGIIISRGGEPDLETIDKARQENIPIMTTNLPTFEVAGVLYGMLNKS